MHPSHYILIMLLLFNPSLAFSDCINNRGTGDLGIIIQRASGAILIINQTQMDVLCEIKGLGDLSHASVVFSPDQKYAYIFARDGGLSKIDILNGNISKRIVQAGNSIGGAISQDGKLIAVSNYKPGGVKVFDSKTLSLLYTIPAITDDQNKHSKTVGLVDAPNNRFIFSLFEGDSTWILDLSTRPPKISKFQNIGRNPYDALITSNGRYYIAGLFGEDGLALLDTWHPEKGMVKILSGYGRGKQKLPVYKMPHLEGWAIANGLVFLPAVGQHKLLVAELNSWQEKTGIPVYSQPVFAMARPDERQIWVNFAFPDNHIIQVIDTDTLSITKELELGKGVLHMEFTAKGKQVWISVRDKNEVQIYDTQSFNLLKILSAKKPSGIFFTHRANRIGL